MLVWQGTSMNLAIVLFLSNFATAAILTLFHLREVKRILKNRVDSVCLGFWVENGVQNSQIFFTEEDVRADSRVKAWIKTFYRPGYQNPHLQKIQIRQLPNEKFELVTIVD